MIKERTQDSPTKGNLDSEPTITLTGVSPISLEDSVDQMVSKMRKSKTAVAALTGNRLEQIRIQHAGFFVVDVWVGTDHNHLIALKKRTVGLRYEFKKSTNTRTRVACCIQYTLGYRGDELTKRTSDLSRFLGNLHELMDGEDATVDNIVRVIADNGGIKAVTRGHKEDNSKSAKKSKSATEKLADARIAFCKRLASKISDRSLINLDDDEDIELIFSVGFRQKRVLMPRVATVDLPQEESILTSLFEDARLEKLSDDELKQDSITISKSPEELLKDVGASIAKQAASEDEQVDETSSQQSDEPVSV